MSNSDKVSVVLPTHNGERYLEDSIASVVAQTYQNWELIIVDDASSDGSPSIIAPRVSKDCRIQSVRLEKNRKLPGALNEGFGRATGSHFSWTSDDNIYRRNAFERMMDVMQNDSTIDFVYANCTLIDSDGTPVRLYEVGTPEELPMGNCVGACFLYRRTVHEELRGYDEGLLLAEDYDFWLRASTRFHLKPLHESLYSYRVHPASLTSRHAQDALLAREATLNRWLASESDVTRRKRIEARLALANNSFGVGCSRVGRRNWLRAAYLARHPFLPLNGRSFIVDLFLGSTLGTLVRGFVRRWSK
jgi:glycosyltransferase involved in cell wall biosynthesis